MSRPPSFYPTHLIRSLLFGGTILVPLATAQAQDQVQTQDTADQLLQNPATQHCLQQEVLKPENMAHSVAELLQVCLAQAGSEESPDAADSDNLLLTEAATTTRSAQAAAERQMFFFQPYKDNYIAFGRMNTRDGSEPFSGADLDIKFELGLSFSLFGTIPSLKELAPLQFGYSQRSWWNISDESSPFSENNYNPEVFWEFDQPERPLFGRPPFIDIVGFEHQSNGLSGLDSRSWDRVYIQKTVTLLPQLSAGIKLWNIIDTDPTNDDIRHYLGSGQLDLQFHPNDRTRIRLRLTRGSQVDKYSYRADIIYRRPWLNTAFFVTYYDGYGEALINYNRKSRSLRAGFYFPLEPLLQ